MCCRPRVIATLVAVGGAGGGCVGGARGVGGGIAVVVLFSSLFVVSVFFVLIIISDCYLHFHVLLLRVMVLLFVDAWDSFY